MTTRRQMLAKALLGLALVALAGLAAVVVKDVLASREPENALPTLNVWWNTGHDEGQLLSSSHVKRDKYEWRFLFAPKQGGGVDLTPWLEIPPAMVNPGARLELEFSWAPKQYTVYRMLPTGALEEQVDDLNAPSTAGQYIFMVQAAWEAHRTVQYYFVIEVPVW